MLSQLLHLLTLSQSSSSPYNIRISAIFLLSFPRPLRSLGPLSHSCWLWPALRVNIPFTSTSDSFDRFCCLPCASPVMKVKIKKWHAVATWRWDMPEDEVCGICRVQFDGTCPTCKFPGDDCTLLMGKCGHSFHMVCIYFANNLSIGSLQYSALPLDMDPARFRERAVPYVSTE